MISRASILPLMIPLIIMGGILTGWFTPTEADMVASVYILVILVPLLARGHIPSLPRDFVYTCLLYSIPLALVRGGVYWWVLGAQVLLLLAALGSRLAGGRIRLLAVPHYYLLVTAATLIALGEVVTRGVPPVWEKAEGTR